MLEYMKEGEISILKPNSMMVAIKWVWKTFEVGKQEDAHEYIVMLLQSIIKASLGNDLKAIKKYESKSVIFRLFGGKLRSRVICGTCNQGSNTFDPFLSLSLVIPLFNTLGHWSKTKNLL